MEIGGAILIGMWIGYAILGLWIYHKVFTVYYASASNGLMKELVYAAFFGFIMTFVTLHFWKISIVVLLILGLILTTKVEDKSKKITIIAVFIVISIFIGMLGKDINSTDTDDNTTSQTAIICNRLAV